MDSANNRIYGNNFDQNNENAVVPFIRNAPFNFWDNGTLGNYWSDYKGADADGNGIGDTPYIIELTYHDYEQKKNVTIEQGRDNYPCTTPIDISSIMAELSEPAPSEPNSAAEPQVSEPNEHEPHPSIPVLVTSALIIATVAGLAYFSRYKTKKKESPKSISIVPQANTGDAT